MDAPKQPFDIAAILAQAGADYTPAASRNGDALDPVTPQMALQLLAGMAITVTRNAEAQGAKTGLDVTTRTAPQIMALTIHRNGKSLVPLFLRDVDPRGPVQAFENTAENIELSKRFTALAMDEEGPGPAVQLIAQELAGEDVDAVVVWLPTITFTGEGKSRAQADKAALKKRGFPVGKGPQRYGKIPKGAEGSITFTLYTPWHEVSALIEASHIDLSQPDQGAIKLAVGAGHAVIHPPYPAEAVQAAYWTLYSAPANEAQA